MSDVDYVLPHDTANTLVLPAKGQTKSSTNKAHRVKDVEKPRLSNKAAKRAAKLAELKHKRALRKNLVSDLQKFELTNAELKEYSLLSELNKRRTEAKRLRKLSKPHRTREVIEANDDQRELLSLPSTSILTSSTCLVRPSFNVPAPIEEERKEHNKPQRCPIKNTVPLAAVPSSPAVFLLVLRDPTIQQQRLQLPILAEEAAIIEAIREAPVTVICGETGSGKTTQVPQFLYEAGFTEDGRMIGITEPRRVAAVSMSQRVRLELGIKDSTVGYQIRFEGNTTGKTRIKFMTDGVLLRELKDDFLLSKYSVLIIDEAHERSVYTDVLIGLLSRIVPLREKKNLPKLKLVIMSATLRVEDFTSQRLFKTPPKVITVGSRQFPVTIHFNRVTKEDYVQAAYKKVCQIHRTQPDGGILVFLSGQKEVNTLVSMLRSTFPLTNFESEALKCEDSRTINSRGKSHRKRPKTAKDLPKVDLDDYTVSCVDLSEMDFMDSFGDNIFETPAVNCDGPAVESEQPLSCLPLYSLLPIQKQTLIFNPPPFGSRLCVVATNVAETSLTIPNVKYVVDTGKEKVRQLDHATGISRFAIQWIAKASANQRAGRAGRTSPGHCYRLYSSAVYNVDFKEFADPQIMSIAMDELVLQLKTMGISHVDKFPFPSAPDSASLLEAENRLVRLAALEYTQSELDKSSTQLTPLGRSIGQFPVIPSYGKMLALAHQHNLEQYVICLVAALTVREPLINLSSLAVHLNQSTTPDDKVQELARLAKIRRQWAGTGESLLFGDMGVLLKAVGAAEFESMSVEFCKSHGLNLKAMLEIRKLRRQLTEILNLINTEDVAPKREITFGGKMVPPNDAQTRLLRQILLASMAENVAMRQEIDNSSKEVAYLCPNLADTVFVHPSSVLHKKPPKFVVYQEVIEGFKKYLFNVAAIEPEWLPIYAPSHCNIAPPSDSDVVFYNADMGLVSREVFATFGISGWPIPPVSIRCEANLRYYQALAEAFLEGNVFPKLKEYRPILLAAPVILHKKWSKNQQRIARLLEMLVTEKVQTVKDFERVWQSDPTFLCKEYCDWLPESMHEIVKHNWPPVNFS